MMKKEYAGQRGVAPYLVGVVNLRQNDIGCSDLSDKIYNEPFVEGYFDFV